MSGHLTPAAWRCGSGPGKPPPSLAGPGFPKAQRLLAAALGLPRSTRTLATVDAATIVLLVATIALAGVTAVLARSRRGLALQLRDARMGERVEEARAPE